MVAVRNGEESFHVWNWHVYRLELSPYGLAYLINPFGSSRSAKAIVNHYNELWEAPSTRWCRVTVSRTSAGIDCVITTSSLLINGRIRSRKVSNIDAVVLEKLKILSGCHAAIVVTGCIHHLRLLVHSLGNPIVYRWAVVLVHVCEQKEGRLPKE